MYFLIDSGFQIHNCCADKHEVFKMLLDSLQQICAVAVIQTNNWDSVEKEGFHYMKRDNEIELRKYTIVQGFISEYIEYEEINTFYISDFSSPSINVFLEQLKEEIRERYVRENAKASTFAQIKKNAQRDASAKGR